MSVHLNGPHMLLQNLHVALSINGAFTDVQVIPFACSNVAHGSLLHTIMLVINPVSGELFHQVVFCGLQRFSSFVLLV